MMRFAVAALVTTGVLARWSDPDAFKENAARAIERRHGLASGRQKGGEGRRTRADKRVLTDDQKEGVRLRVLKRARDRDADAHELGGVKESKGGARDNGEDAHEPDVVKESKGGKDDKDEDEDGGGSDARTGADGEPSESRSAGTSAGSKSDKPPPSPSKAPSNGGSPMHGKSGKARGDYYGDDDGDDDYGDDDYYFDGESKSDKGGKSESHGKARKVSTGTCAKRLRVAYDAISALGPDEDGPFGLIERPSDVTDLCLFVPPDADDEDFNFGCPFLYVPDLGFLRGSEEHVEVLGEEAGEAFQSLTMYCQCHQGFELGCAAKIPHGPPARTKEYRDATGEPREVTVSSYSEFIPFGTPGGRAEYCKMVGVWNGDFDSDIAQDFAPDVEDCGCYFVGQARDMVEQCPGVDLGAFFEFPSSPSIAPTPSVPDATFYDSFESRTFPEDPWSVESSTDGSSSSWALSAEEADSGAYSIATPILSNDDLEFREANVTLSTDGSLGRGTLAFSLLSRVNAPADAVGIIVDGEILEVILEPSDGWTTREIFLGPGPHKVTWSYAYNPGGRDDISEAGGAFVDDVHFVPAASPTFSPTTGIPSYSPMVFPTVFPTVSPTGVFPTIAPVLAVTPVPTVTSNLLPRNPSDSTGSSDVINIEFASGSGDWPTYAPTEE